MTIENIQEWIVQQGGILPTTDNHFGGDPKYLKKSTLNLNIQQRPGELSKLVDFFLKRKSCNERLEYYAEIGACSGGTTFVLNHFLNFKRILIIDDGGAESSHYISERGDNARATNLGTTHRIEIIGSSLNNEVIAIAKTLAAINTYDILFIDGEHTYNAVMSDTMNYVDIVREKGYIVYHDSAHKHEVSDCINKILEATDKFILIENFFEKDAFTESFPNGIGLTVLQKK